VGVTKKQLGARCCAGSHLTYYDTHTHTHTHPFNGPFSGTTNVSQYQKGKTNLVSLKQETMSGSGISWAICKSAPRSSQITTPAPHHSVFLQAGCPSCCPTNSVKALKATRQSTEYSTLTYVESKGEYCDDGAVDRAERSAGVREDVSKLFLVHFLQLVELRAPTPAHAQTI